MCKVRVCARVCVRAACRIKVSGEEGGNVSVFERALSVLVLPLSRCATLSYSSVLVYLPLSLSLPSSLTHLPETKILSRKDDSPNYSTEDVG